MISLLVLFSLVLSVQVVYSTTAYSYCGADKYYPAYARANGVECCNNTGLYNPKYSTCCNGTLTSTMFGRDCCGSTAYNKSLFVCCNGTLHLTILEYENSTSCCGTINYNPNTEICCTPGVVHPSDNFNEKTRCCGSVTYNSYEETCCNGVVYSFRVSDKTCHYLRLLSHKLVSHISANSHVSVDATPLPYCLENSLSKALLSSSKQCPNGTMIQLAPGETLDKKLVMKNTLKVEIHPRSSNSAVVVCKRSGTIKFENISRVHIRDVVFVGCTGIQITMVDELILENCSFSGPAKVADSAVTLRKIFSAKIIETSFISYNNVKNGVLSIYSCQSVVIKRSNFKQNTAIMSGGSIYGEGNGGCLYSNSSIIEISDSMFIGNTAEGWGGGCIYASHSDIKLTSSMFRNNTALTHHGGVLYMTWSSTDIKNCSFKENNAPNGRGGVLNAYYYDDMPIGNKAERSYRQKVTVSIAYSMFYENKATVGGAVYIHYDNNVKIKDSVFMRNQATSLNGGAVYLHNNAILDDCIFHENKAQQDGGGVYVFDSLNVTIDGCVFTGNIAARSGGGLGLYRKNVVDIKESVFRNNTAVWGDGRCIYSQTDNVMRIDTATQKTILRDPGCLYKNN